MDSGVVLMIYSGQVQSLMGSSLILSFNVFSLSPLPSLYASVSYLPPQLPFFSKTLAPIFSLSSIFFSMAPG